MSTLNESIVEDAALEWFLLRSAPLNYDGQVGDQPLLAAISAALRLPRVEEEEREAIRRPAGAGPAIPEETREEALHGGVLQFQPDILT